MLSKHATLHQLRTVYDFEDLLDFGELIDMEAEASTPEGKDK